MFKKILEKIAKVLYALFLITIYGVTGWGILVGLSRCSYDLYKDITTEDKKPAVKEVVIEVHDTLFVNHYEVSGLRDSLWNAQQYLKILTEQVRSIDPYEENAFELTSDINQLRYNLNELKAVLGDSFKLGNIRQAAWDEGFDEGKSESSDY